MPLSTLNTVNSCAEIFFKLFKYTPPLCFTEKKNTIQHSGAEEGLIYRGSSKTELPREILTEL